MSKGARLPPVVMKRTKIHQFDEFFRTASDPMQQLVGTNNDMDEQVKELRSIGQEIKKTSAKDAPPPVFGTLVVKVNDCTVIPSVEKDGQPVAAKNLDSVAKSYLANVETKAKLMAKRLSDVRKLKGLENAAFKVGGKRPYHLELAADKEAVKTHEDSDEMSDFRRSITKFNDRADILAIYLNGPVTLSESVSAIINSIKNYMQEKKKKFKIGFEGGKPVIKGIPTKVEDFFPDLLARGWKLLNSVLEYIEEQKKNLPLLDDKIRRILDESKSMPGQLRSAATSSNLSTGDMLKAGKALSSNTKMLSGAPTIVAQLSKTLTDTSTQIVGAVQSRDKSGEDEDAE